MTTAARTFVCTEVERYTNSTTEELIVKLMKLAYMSEVTTLMRHKSLSSLFFLGDHFSISCLTKIKMKFRCYYLLTKYIIITEI